MALPAAVQKQVDEANEIAAKLYPKPDAAADDAPATPPAAATPPQPGSPPADPPATPPVTQTPPVDWEQRYKVLQGKYNAEVPRLTGQVRDLTTNFNVLRDQLQATQMLLASLNQKAPAGSPPSGEAPPSGRLVKDEEVREFGPDLYDFIRRTAAEAVLPEVENRIRPVSEQVEKVASASNFAAREVAKTAEQKVLDFLTAEIPEWGKLNEDPEFLAWLDLPDVFSGEKRADLLTRAYQRHDGPRVVAFFKSYLNEHGIVTPADKPAADPKAPQVDLKNLVAPGTQKAGTVDAQDGANKRIWTAAEIGKFYDECAKGKYSRNPKKAAEIEADIFRAQKEGRIR